MEIRNYISAILFFVIGFAYSQSTNALIYKGNKDYGNKKYDHATTQYLDALKKTPNSFDGHYNLANTLYRQGMYKEAQEEYEKASKFAKNPNQEVGAYYNQGNTAMMTQQYGDAVDLYKNALKLNPNDPEIKRNYEIARLRLKQKQQQQNNRHNNQNRKNQQQNNQSQQQQKQQQQKQQQQDQRQNQKQNQRPEKRQMSKQQEKNILDQISNKEKNTAKRVLNQRGNNLSVSNEKDW